MASIVHQTASGKPLVSGLDWRLLPATGSLDGHVREGAKDRGAKYLSVATSNTGEEIRVKGKRRQIHRSAAGYFPGVDDAKPPKGAHSLAAAFARWAQQHEAALLNVQTPDGMYAVVVVINGLPVLDRLEKERAEAYDKALPYLQERPNISVFSDDMVLYPTSLLGEGLLTKIGAAANKSTQLKAVPPNAAAMLLLAVLVLGATGGFWYHSKWKAEKARQEAIARQRAADPIPKYLNALAAARESAGLQRDALVASFRAIERIPVAPQGWRITKLGCSATSGCSIHFFRNSGTYEGLRSALPDLELVPSSDINLNEARMNWKQDLGFDHLDPSTQLPGLSAFLQGEEASKLQTWLVAGLTVQISPPQLWPQAPGVPQSFKHPKALAAGKFEVTTVALPQLVEVLTSAPANVKWTAWSIEIGDAKQEPLTRAKARLTGTYYVTNY